MSKNAVFQFFVESNGVGKLKHYKDLSGIPEWGKVSVEYFKRYSKKHNADYYFFSDRYIDSISNYFQKCRVYMDPLFDNYEKVLYVDIDVIPKDMEQSIFDVDCVDIAGVEEQRHPMYINQSINWPKHVLSKRFANFGAPLIDASHNSSWPRMINTGVMLWSKQARLKAREQFDSWDEWFKYKNNQLDKSLGMSWGHSSHCLDQPFFNAMWNKYNFNVNPLPVKWNRFPCKDENYPCAFAHYVNETRYKIPERFKI